MIGECDKAARQAGNSGPTGLRKQKKHPQVHPLTNVGMWTAPAQLRNQPQPWQPAGVQKAADSQRSAASLTAVAAHFFARRTAVDTSALSSSSSSSSSSWIRNSSKVPPKAAAAHFFARRTAVDTSAPFASSAAMADARLHPVPCVLPVLQGQAGAEQCNGAVRDAAEARQRGQNGRLDT